MCSCLEMDDCDYRNLLPFFVRLLWCDTKELQKLKRTLFYMARANLVTAPHLKLLHDCYSNLRIRLHMYMNSMYVIREISVAGSRYSVPGTDTKYQIFRHTPGIVKIMFDA